MAIFYSNNNIKKQTDLTACKHFKIESLDYQGHGVAKRDGKIWFVEGALPEERIEGIVLEEKHQYGRAKAKKIITSSPFRQLPFCADYAQCGGCQMQHIAIEYQRKVKESNLQNRLQKLQFRPIEFQPMIISEDKGYRRRAKISIKVDKTKVILGFRMSRSQQIVPIHQCNILTVKLSQLIAPFQQLCQSWQQKKHLGHIELIETESGISVLFRHLGKITNEDNEKLLTLAKNENINLFVMNNETDIHLEYGNYPYYLINDLHIYFSIRDFIQINPVLNKKMVNTAIEWLALSQHDNLLDLFCGVGNFTLPMAKKVAKIIGIEGVKEMVIQAQKNALINNINNAEFYQADLTLPLSAHIWKEQYFNKIILDPARDGALFVLDYLIKLNPEYILYVSCNPATLIRDAEKLIQAGYILKKSAMIDMFPHTSHLESISLFSR